ncbi:hypothetical protein H5410_031827, partial [Solanum commersonii]
NHVETTDPLEQKEKPSAHFPANQLSSSKYKQLFSYSPTGCSHPLVVATQPVHPLHQPQSWIEYELRDQAVFFTMDINRVNTMIIIQNPNFLAQLITEGMKMAMDNYVNHYWMENVLSPLAPAMAPTMFHNMQPQWSLLPQFNPLEAIDNNPLFFFSWVPIPLQGYATQMHPQSSMENHQTPIWQAGSSHQPPLWQEGSAGQDEVPRNSFTEISTLKHKYIYICPVALVKCFFDLHLAVNTALAKYEVNIRSGNNPTFKMKFRELIHNHNPCMVALVETRMISHEGLKDEFGFDDFLEVPTISRSGGLVLLWNTALVTVLGLMKSDQEVHAMI